MKSFEERIVILETQVARIVSDIESEKATRARANAEIAQQLREFTIGIHKLEKANWKAAGAITAIIFIVQLFSGSFTAPWHKKETPPVQQIQTKQPRPPTQSKP